MLRVLGAPGLRPGRGPTIDGAVPDTATVRRRPAPAALARVGGRTAPHKSAAGLSGRLLPRAWKRALEKTHHSFHRCSMALRIAMIAG